jgi:TPR repeat protein
MVPLLDSLREFQSPESNSPQTSKLNEQARRELRSLHQQALATPAGAKQRAEAGQAAWLLGLLYLHGAGVVTDPAKARQWFVLSEHYGEPMASAGLAWCALAGCQIAPNLVQAQYWSQRLMPVDSARAAYLEWLIERQLRPLLLGGSDGLGSLRSGERSLLEKAVAGGDVHAMIDMGTLLAQDGDLPRALDILDRASSRSEVARQNAAWIRKRIALAPTLTQPGSLATDSALLGEASFKKARQYHRGDGVSISYADAIRLYRQAESEGSAQAKHMLALIYSRTTIDGELDPVWMRQLGNLDQGSTVPKQDTAWMISALRREPTPLIDALPTRWRQWIEQD